MIHNEPIEAVVIGSGFGGAIAANHLAKAGIKTVVLERGRTWPISPEGNTFCTYRKPDSRAAWLSPETVMFEPAVSIDVYTGLLDRKIENGITVWVAAGVGGGSLVYNGVLYQPTRENFNRVFRDAVDYDEMNEIYYRRVASILNPQPIPEDILATEYYLSTRVFMDQAKQAGLSTRLLNVAVDWDIVRQEIRGEKVASAIDGEIWYGINSGAKNSLDHNYLAQAQASGHVEILPLHVVTEITEEQDYGFRITCTEINTSGEEITHKSFTCKYLFMGAGSMGTSELLVRARDKGTLSRLNDQVGAHWGNNADTFATRKAGVRTNPGQGGPATAVIENLDNPYLPQTFIVYPEWDAPEATLTTLGMSIPTELGSFAYDRATDKVKLSWPADAPGNLKMLAAANHAYSMLDQQAAAQADPDFIGEKTQANAGITAHPLGGVVLGQACDLYGRVHGYKGLYVVDGALIPGSTAATNPAFTIAALAERCMDKIIAEDIS